MFPIDIEKARGFLLDRERKRLEALRKRFREAQSDFKKIVTMIKERYKPLRIYQWGSLLDEEHFSEISDIDLAIEGITSAEEFFKLYGDAEKLTSFPIDIVQIEKIEPEFRELIVKRGRLIYERKS